ncbi:hypothetical protein ACODM8_13675 [Vibrio ostreicida]|uniref:hypothetical protein n=1 Tax=Vibrio ostreicida TaxID=526588 RepID=UPI003B5B0629
MFDIIKFALFVFGCVAAYGLATGQDLNELFAQTGETAIPAAKAVIQAAWEFVLGALSK